MNFAPKLVNRYAATDGKLFETAEDAACHSRALYVLKEIRFCHDSPNNVISYETLMSMFQKFHVDIRLKGKDPENEDKHPMEDFVKRNMLDICCVIELLNDGLLAAAKGKLRGLIEQDAEDGLM